jgi:hypothetical protein
MADNLSAQLNVLSGCVKKSKDSDTKQGHAHARAAARS